MLHACKDRWGTAKGSLAACVRIHPTPTVRASRCARHCCSFANVRLQQYQLCLTQLAPPSSAVLLVFFPLAGIAYWDVYKSARLDVFRPKAQVSSGLGGGDTVAGVHRSTAASSKASRVQHATHSAGKLPASFTSNSPKEQALLAYVDDFQRVFKEFYPHRCAEMV